MRELILSRTFNPVMMGLVIEQSVHASLVTLAAAIAERIYMNIHEYTCFAFVKYFILSSAASYPERLQPNLAYLASKLL